MRRPATRGSQYCPPRACHRWATVVSPVMAAERFRLPRLLAGATVTPVTVAGVVLVGPMEGQDMEGPEVRADAEATKCPGEI